MLTELANSHQIDLNSKDRGLPNDRACVIPGQKSYISQKFVKFAKSLPIFELASAPSEPDVLDF